MQPQETLKDALISIPIHSSTRDFIDQAAKVIGKDRSDFVLEAAYEKAQEILSDQTTLTLNNKQWDAFNSMLDTPPKMNNKLKTLLIAQAPWSEWQ